MVAQLEPIIALTDPDVPSLAYLCSRHPLWGGEYYRATRPGALASWKWGWQTAACDRMATMEDDDDGQLSFITPNQTVVTPEIIVVRPIQEWSQAWTDQAHANGQFVVADLDDDLWSHERYDELQAESPDNYMEWFPNVDAVLVSTRYLAKRVREMGHKAPVYVAPNCYDPFGMNGNPRPGDIIGTRLWMSGRMEPDLVLYDTLIQPLLEEFNLRFLHVGAGQEMGRFIDRGWDEERLIERHSVPIPMLSQVLDGLSIGTICMADVPYNVAKTETHAVELASMGVPLVAASNHNLYKNIPGRVDIDKDAVHDRVKALLDDPYYWLKESDRARKWARGVSVKSEQAHLGALLQCVNKLLS
jgi:hypothetical protein